ncbi:MAG: hypothetical protein LUC38_02935 [Oscillospiraceae bacterium]|nr:hypothetical protein [Ruminococcus sp.]MCD8344900.1 hypothetical protein [Oscillospiraceae bacterium]
MKKNTMSLASYLAYQVIWTLGAMLWYRGLFFTALPGISVALSKTILWVMTIVLVAVGSLLTKSRWRNWFSVVVNILLPYELYTIFAYYIYLPRLVWASVAVSVVMVVVFFVLAMFMPIKNITERKAIILKRLKNVFMRSRFIIAMCLLILIVPIGFSIAFGHGLLNTSVESVVTTRESRDWTIAYNMDTVLLLQEEEWSQLDEQEKLDVLGVIANIEIRYLGINHELYLKTAIIGGGTLAYYDDMNYEIVIDIDHLRDDDAYEVLQSLCHECYHSYQHQLIELYESTDDEYKGMLVFMYVDAYIEEFADYDDGEDSFWGYYSQVSEIMARSYAYNSVNDYYEHIEEYFAE